MEDYLPVYACADMSVHLEPGNCPSCGSKLSQIGAADASMYLATHELWA
jgi:predicted RNA-binding protein with PUA domain